ncbi:hypothetical protein TrLO_g4947 [Triparma laevis f. longispina]|uniref:Peroxisomal membrane protein MPV17 n=1 Tax=Triparma laevis f. longispina TaxID=1714387 RepID=A0A9W7FS39_9STRA|nr:hypothetical protein TrLO_g4947 [Triparma laevis f. longispina]
MSPLLTKSLTSSLISFLGDFLVQSLTSQSYSLKRSISFGLEALFISGPIMHYTYEFLEKKIPSDNKWNVGLQLIIDCVIMDAVYIMSSFWVTGLIQGLTYNTILKQVKRDFLGTFRACAMGSLGVGPVEFFFFRFGNVKWRCLGVNLTDVAWNGVVSFWVSKGR